MFKEKDDADVIRDVVVGTDDEVVRMVTEELVKM
jgi:hypothetical protein